MLTALIHHVKNAEQFSVVGDLLVKEFAQQLALADAHSHPNVRIIEVISIPCSVRHGSRLSGTSSLTTWLQILTRV
jgi:hypothetical protein